MNEVLRVELVSIIVACYNVESFIARFLDSLLEQTYKRLEIIIVNDGSTDKTGEVILKYDPLLVAQGYYVKIVNQQNRGLAGAVDTGLKHFRGEFLTWLDPDDWLTPNSIELRVARMREYPDAGLLRTVTRNFIQDEGLFRGHLGEPGSSARWRPDLFALFFLGRTHYHNTGHFVRSSAFLATTGRSIHVAPGGNSQNIQMLLPLTERFATVETGDLCAYYAVRRDSRSHRDVNAAPKARRILMLLENILQTIPKLAGDHDRYRSIARSAWLRNRQLVIAFEGNLVKEGELALGECGLGKTRAFLARWVLRAKARHFPDWNRLTPDGAKPPITTRAFLKLVRFNPDLVVLPLPPRS